MAKMTKIVNQILLNMNIIKIQKLELGLSKLIQLKYWARCSIYFYSFFFNFFLQIEISRSFLES